MERNPSSRHSAIVLMDLTVDGQTFSISHMSDDYVILKDPVAFPPTIATIRISIDGNERSGEMYLPEGIDPARTRTKLESVKAAQTASAAA